ncbi:MAG: glutamate ligase domain-containing protein, partial [Intrasporangium sp.]|uniref:glutamate ligase domain-containing protein n=1 Tax=Intrasporangium sp. TaxID=1925024 RepID=UPI003F8012FC
PYAVAAPRPPLRPSPWGGLGGGGGAGGDRVRGPGRDWGGAAAPHADVVVVTDDNPRSEDPGSIREAVRSGAERAVRSGHATATLVVDGGTRTDAITNTVAEAVRAAREHGRTDTVVILGKGHETGQEVGGVVHPFDDREAVRTALAAAGLHPTPPATTPTRPTTPTTPTAASSGGTR